MEQGKSILGEAAGKLGITRKPSPGEGQGVANEAQNADTAKEETQTGTVLKNRAAESRSPYVSLLLTCRSLSIIMLIM
jgi:hypothetical protein